MLFSYICRSCLSKGTDACCSSVMQSTGFLRKSFPGDWLQHPWGLWFLLVQNFLLGRYLCIKLSLSSSHDSCPSICPAGAALIWKRREDGSLPSPSPPPRATAPSPHILQNHVDLLNRCVKLIILWVLGNQWIVNCTLLKQLQSSDWSIILWGMNKDKSFSALEAFLATIQQAWRGNIKEFLIFLALFCFSASWIK